MFFVLFGVPGLRGRPYRARFVSGSGSCAAAGMSGLLASCLAAIGGR